MFGSKPFGSTGGTFGSNTGSSLFGQNKPATTSLFGGSTAQPQSSSLFGQKPTTSLFGSSSPAQPSSIFGSTAANNSGSSLFGTQNKPSLFGSTTANTSFGASGNTGSSLFGNTSNTGSSLFGGSSTTQNGTTIKFDPPVASDTMMKNGSSQNINTKHMCITAMKQYETKSLEELRVEDYMANRKAPQAGSTTSGGLFGSTNTSNTGTGLFGSSTPQNKSIFGSNNSTSFGGTATTGTTSLFGSSTPQQQSTSLFGSKPATGGLFGSSTGAATFGSPSTNQTTSLFGATAQQPSTFGQQSTGGGLFGGGTSTFGATGTSQPSTGFSFGASATPAASTSLFGSTANTSATGGGLFGAKPAATGGFGFGGTPATNTFGAPAATGGLFGSSPAAKPGGLFGSTTTTTGGGLFGSTQPAQTGTGLFGSTQPQQTTSLFGAQPVQQATAATMPSQVAVATVAPIVLGSDVNQRQIERALFEAQLAASPYGDAPLLKWMNKTAEDTDSTPNPVSAQRQMKFLASKMSSPSMNVNGSLVMPSLTKPGSVANSPALNKSNGKTPLVLKDLAYSSSSRPPTLGRGLRHTPAMDSSNMTSSRRLNVSKLNATVDNVVDTALSSTNSLQSPSVRQHIKYLDPSVMMMGGGGTPNRTVTDPDELPRMITEDTVTTGSQSPHVGQNQPAKYFSPSEQPAAAAMERELNLRQNQPPRLNLDMTGDESSMQSPKPPVSVSSPLANTTVVISPRREASIQPSLVTLSNEEYFCEPSLAAIRDMTKDGWVELPDGLRIGRATYGSVYWPGPLRIRELNIDEVVVFRHKEVTVYPDETMKPMEGEGLNRPAEVTLERVWPSDKATKLDIKDPLILVEMGWRERLERVTARMGAVFKDYRPTTGSWVFRVEHFSKYGLPEDDSDEECGVVVTDNVTRVNLSLNESQLHGLVQRQKVNLLPPDEDMQMDKYNEKMSVRAMPVTNHDQQKMFGGLGGGLLQPTGLVRGLFGEVVDNGGEMIPEKRSRLNEEDEEMQMDDVLNQCQKLLDQVEGTGHGGRKLQLECASSHRQFTSHTPSSVSLSSSMNGPVDVAAAMGVSAPVRFNALGFFTRSCLPVANQVEVVHTQYPDDIDPLYVEDMFEHNIRLSDTITRNRSTSARVKHCELENQVGAPRIKPSTQFAELIDSYLATSQQSGRQREYRIWELCKALFPAQKTETDEWLWERNRLVGEWIRDYLTDKHHPINEKKREEKGEGEKTWRAICCGQIDKIPAGDEKLFNLCSLLGMCKEQRTREKIHKQLEYWHSSGHLEHVSPSELKSYVIMSGQSEIVVPRNGEMKIVNVMEGLHWMQALGLYIWYGGEDRGTLEESVQRITEDMSAGRVAVPVRDIGWELIQLSINGLHPVHNVLDAAVVHSHWNIDFHLSWHLWCVLRSVGHTQIDSESEQRLHNGYGQQLLTTRLPHLAAFVLSHISNDQCRSASLHSLLDRIAPWFCASDYEKLIETVKLPSQWIASARAIKAKLMGNRKRECELYLEAGEHSVAEQLFANHIGPMAIAAADWGTLQHFVSLFEESRKAREGTSAETTFSPSVLMYSEYVQLREGKGVEYDDLVLQLCDVIDARLDRLRFTTPVQKMTLATISRHLLEVRRGLTGKIQLSNVKKSTLCQLSAISDEMEINFD